MANEFTARNGIIAKNNSIISGSLLVTGSLTVTGSLRVSGSITGSIFGTASRAVSASMAVLAPSYLPLAGGTMTGDIYAAGRLFTFQDLTLGAGTTVGTIKTDGSKPIGIYPNFNFETTRFYANGNVGFQNGGTYTDTGYRIQVSASNSVSGALQIIGTSVITGSLRVSGGVTGSLVGTASWATNATNATNATTATTADLALFVNELNQNVVITGSLSNGLSTTAVGLYSHAEGYNTITGTQTAHESYITAGNVFINGDVTSLFTEGGYLYLYDVEFDNVYQYASFLINSISFTGTETRITLADSSVNATTAYVGDLSYFKNNATFGGDKTIPTNYSHTEGNTTIALGPYSHAEGLNTQAIGNYSHAEGSNTITYGTSSHAEGLGTIANSHYQHAQGLYNATSSIEGAFMLGNGVDDSTRSNLIFAAGTQVEITGSLNVTQGITGDLTGTASNVAITNDADTRIVTANGNGTLNGEGNLTFNGSLLNVAGNILVTGSAAIGTGSLGPYENTLTLGARDTGSEGGQLGFNAPGGTYTSASFIDLYQNKLRILKGTNATSTGEVASWNMHNLQMSLPAYTASSSFAGTATAGLAVNSNGDVITIPHLYRRVNVVDSSTVSGSTLQLLYSQLIPANTFAAGDIVRVSWRGQKLSAVSSNTASFYVNTANSLSGATFLGSYQSTVNVRMIQLDRKLYVKNATTNTEMYNIAQSSAGEWTANPTSLFTTSSINWTVDQYLIAANQLTNGSDSFKGSSFEIERIRSTS